MVNGIIGNFAAPYRESCGFIYNAAAADASQIRMTRSLRTTYVTTGREIRGDTLLISRLSRSSRRAVTTFVDERRGRREDADSRGWRGVSEGENGE